MSKRKVIPSPADELRRCAEKKLALRGEAPAYSQAGFLKLVHELQVHQIELEMQNDALRAAQAEIEEGQRFADLYEFAPVAYLSIAADSRIRLLNRTGASLLGLPGAQLKGQLLASYMTPDSRPVFNTFLATAFAEGGHQSCELDLLPMNRRQPLAVLIEAVTDPEKEICNLAISDISALKNAEEALREQKEFFRLVAENIDGFIAVLDSRGRRIYNSPSYAHLLGERNITGSLSFVNVHPADRDRVEQAFRETIVSGIGQHLEYRFMTENGEICLMESHGGVVRDAEGAVKYVVVLSRDVTERHVAAEKIHHLAFHDPLTQLPNRLTLNDRLQHAMAASKRSGRYGALLFLDLDHFKPLNDAYGHEAGDLLLVEAAQRIVKCVREMDTVARFGGDEFVVMLGELDVDFAASMVQAELVAEKIRSSLAAPYFLAVNTCGGVAQEFEHHCTASIGMTLFLDHERSQEEVLKSADIAMYQSKEGGRDRVSYAASQ
ncbi:MAG: sensor domain-containing diguanylate cyclase [Azonexus sp.]|nr:sensor domain-containing diguanylate cyclase [Azonexus sp.]MDZ4314051.1 sensor domain-containing diguanylate cyclase [Azonexus sp.]